MNTTLTLLAALSLGAPALKDREPLGKGPGYLGIMFTQEGGGLTVTEVKKSSPAEKAGIKEGDVIVKLDKFDMTMADTSELVKVVGAMRPGTQVVLEIRRAMETKKIRVKLGPRPPDFETNLPPPVIDPFDR